ncbi:hypothetical protein [Synechococcus sp. UW179A]|uniref:hypothetical protein n=1 Tax=Synechococcus sp. UW179A TaxID=2575510 RepID=UPI0010BE64F5|nr:hypothetical protein [Synechococcus sp. UW179A]
MPTDNPFMPHDDDLFIGQALSISLGDWLGEDYGKFTLIKGPYHSIQVWLSSVVGVPPLLGLRLFYAATCALFCSVALYRLPTFLKSLAFVCLLFDPVLIGTSSSWRLLREASFVPVEVLALACGIYTLDTIVLIGSNHRPSLSIKSHKTLWISLLSSYFCLGLLLITREARIVIIFTSLVYTFILILYAYKYRFLTPKAFLKLVPLVLALLLAFNLPVVSVKALNYMNYGLAISNEFEEGGFKSFYQNLSSVKLAKTVHQPSIPIKKDAIEAIVALDPDSQLAITLSNLNPGWTIHGCKINKDWCDEYSSGWFMWALRDAIFKTSSVDSPGDFQDQVLILSQELVQVCASNPKVLSCQTSSFGYLPYPSRWVPKGQSPFKLFSDIALAHLTWLTSPSPLANYSAVTHNYEQSRSVGVWLTSGYTPAELKTFRQRIANLNQFSSLIRMGLFISFASIVLVIIFWKPRLIVCLFDPGLVLIGTLLLINFLVIVLVEVTSFPSGGYLSMVSPLTTLFIWRYYDRLSINFNSKSSTNFNDLTSV